MSEAKRKNFSGEFKAKVALEAIRGITRKPTRQRKMNGKKLSKRLATEIAAFAVPRPLRLMFQDEARFDRISDVRIGLGQEAAQANGSRHDDARIHLCLWRGQPGRWAL